jgi:hypothetical protein
MKESELFNPSLIVGTVNSKKVQNQEKGKENGRRLNPFFRK